MSNRKGLNIASWLQCTILFAEYSNVVSSRHILRQACFSSVTVIIIIIIIIIKAIYIAQDR